MSPIQQMLLGVGAVATKTYVDDIFSTNVWIGNDATRTISPGFDLSSSGDGGLVWIKSRSRSDDNVLGGSWLGDNKYLRSNHSGPRELNQTARLKTVTSSGFQLGTSDVVNQSPHTYASWCFKNTDNFFKIVEWTGDGSSNRQINHGLGSVPGMIIVKTIDASYEWQVFHRSIGETKGLVLDKTNTSATKDWWNDTAPNATNFTVGGSSTETNDNGLSYVAYVFADGSSKEATSRSVYFDGSSDYLLSTSSDYSPGTGDFTMEAWVNIESGVAATDGIYQLSSTSGAFTYGGIALLYKKSNSENRWELYGGNSTNQSESTAFTGYEYGQWVHTAIVKTSGNIKLYINGEERISATDTQNYSGYQYLGIGAAFGSTYNFKGKVSNFKLTIGQALYTSAFTPTNVPLTTTSQSSTASNVKILCCNNSSVTGKTVGATITSNGTVTASTDNPNFIDTEASIFGENKDQNVIKCGSYVGNGSSTGPEINLGWEPQWILLKNATASSRDWKIVDAMRGITTGGDDASLRPNGSNAEDDESVIDLTPTGFKITASNAHYNENGETIVYCAIRRPDGYVGKPPELGTDVFTTVTMGATSAPGFRSDFPVDFALYRQPAATHNWGALARLAGSGSEHTRLYTNTTGAEVGGGAYKFDYNNGWITWNSDASYQSWMWKRHAGFDVVCWDGTGANNTLNHSLGKTPEMIWAKARSESQSWLVYHKGLNGGTTPWNYYVTLESTGAEANWAAWVEAPTSTQFSIISNWSANSQNYIAMLFASVDGISKVGSYTGNGSTQTITTGFSPRFILFKNSGSGAAWSNWYVYDTKRGIPASGTVNYLLLNKNIAEEGGDDLIDVSSTGFTINVSYDSHNGSGENYIYYCHA